MIKFKFSDFVIIVPLKDKLVAIETGSKSPEVGTLIDFDVFDDQKDSKEDEAKMDDQKFIQESNNGLDELNSFFSSLNEAPAAAGNNNNGSAQDLEIINEEETSEIVVGILIDIWKFLLNVF